MQARILKDTYATDVRRNRGTLAPQQRPQSRVSRNVQAPVSYMHSGYNNTRKKYPTQITTRKHVINVKSLSYSQRLYYNSVLQMWGTVFADLIP